MNTTIRTGLAAILLIAVSCKKENSTIQSSYLTESSTAGVITDIHEPGKYASVVIGTQKWMTKNLDVSRYRNGDVIPYVKSGIEWAALKTGAWCWYRNDSVNGAVYGKLYNWYAVNDPRGLAPKGWHVPTAAEWDTLTVYLGNNPGGKLKDTGTVEAGTGLWYAPNKGATNKSGFIGLPGGYRESDGTFFGIGHNGFWWSSTEYQNSRAWDRHLGYGEVDVGKGHPPRLDGFSVRCLKD
jgi:uncharacterized protein (TIGR02145 family)